MAPDQEKSTQGLAAEEMADPMMDTNNEDESIHHEMDEMMNQYLDSMGGSVETGQSMTVPIVAVHADNVLVDVGGKAEGLVPLRELMESADAQPPKPGDKIDVIVKGQDNETGLILLSHTEARRQAAVKNIQAAVESQSTVRGKITRVVKGGLMVDIGLPAFLPASQVDLRRVENFEPWVGQTIECVILEYVPEKRRIIVSRRKLLEKQSLEKREELLSQLQPGQVLDVEVKRIVDFGAFVDLGGIDGLIPRTEISWQRVNKPDDFLKVGEKIQAKVIEVNKNDKKITLSRRQTSTNPWDEAIAKYPQGSTVEGDVVSITPYGAFVRLEEGLDGMIHISDMAWDSGGKRPQDYVAVGQRATASVINVDPAQKRISLGLKQLVADPWDGIEERYPQGARIKGKVTGLTKYGAFVELEPGIEGMIHVSDFSWEKRINQPKDVVKKGDEVEACVLSIDRERRRIALGVKQLSHSPLELFLTNHSLGDAVEGEIVNLTDFGAFVKLADGVEGFIHVSQLDRNRVESPSSNFKVGETIRAEILKIERDQGKISLSRRQLLKREERSVVKNYMRGSAPQQGSTYLGELLAELNLEDELPKE